MKLYEHFGDYGYHTSVATTFGLDFDTYESIVLPRLRGAGCRNNMIIADSRMLTHALNGASALPQQAGTHYTISDTASSAIFHPKLFLQFGRHGGRLTIASANLTSSGLAGNLELVDTITCTEERNGEQELIAQAWHFVSAFIDSRQKGLAYQQSWMEIRTPWLSSATPATGPVALADGTMAALLTSGQPNGIAKRFADLVDEPIHQLFVISPYWDPELNALTYLATRLGTAEIAVLVDPEVREFPKEAVNAVPGLKLYDCRNFRAGRFIHAKAILAQGNSADHLLLGSANCTRAVLGNEGFAGSNAEACLYRRLPPGSVFQALDLEDIISSEHLIQADTLESAKHTDDLPLDELQQLSAGKFECLGDTLEWIPPAISNPDSCTIHLLDHKEHLLNCTLKLLPTDSVTARRYEMSETEGHPAFAFVTFPDGRATSPAIITQIDTLKIEMRETRRSGTQTKIDELEGDPDASLELLELLDELESLERDQATPEEPLSSLKRRMKDGVDANPSRYRILSYEEFIARSRPQTVDRKAAYNSLAGSEVSIIRSILNRIIGLDDGAAGHASNDALKHSGDLFNLGDETDDPEGALAYGDQFGAQSEIPEEKPSETYTRRANRRRATQEELVKAVEQFQAGIRSRQAADSGLSNYELIRLRTLLVILSTAASPLPTSKIAESVEGFSLQVLPVEGSQYSWPRLMGQVIFMIFGGNDPAIKHLYLGNEHDQVPGDFHECWGTCYWCFQACLHAPFSEQERKLLTRLLIPICIDQNS